MAKIAVTGSNGTVGKALVPRLRTLHEVIPIDLPEVDILDLDSVTKAMRGADVVIHLAGVFGPAVEGKENWRSPHRDPTNGKLFEHALIAAKSVRAKLFIHASSIHVEDSLGHMEEQTDTLLQARPGVFTTQPASGYGQSKRGQEALLQDNAHAFEHGAVSIRLGGVTPANAPLRGHAKPAILAHEQKVWLSHDDLSDLVLRIIDQRTTPDYDVVYAVSDNTGRFHDTANQYGWDARANSANHT
jgi:nucleoside-diphosphate-sugar epimerase